MVKKLLSILSVIVIFVAAFALLSSYDTYRKGKKYTPGINQVLKLENEDLENPGVEKDIDKLERSDAKIQVFDKGKYIQLTYEIRDNDFIDVYYKKLDDGSYDSTISDYFKHKQPDYVENEDLGKE